MDDVRDYVAAKQPSIGRILHLTPPEGSGQNPVASGTHASLLADAVANAVAKARVPFGARDHIFSPDA